MSDEPEPAANDPRDDANLLRPLRLMSAIGEALPAPPAIRPPSGARCEKCGSTMVSSLPYFAAGSGLAFRAIANDVCCQRCGHIGPVDFA